MYGKRLDKIDAFFEARIDIIGIQSPLLVPGEILNDIFNQAGKTKAQPLDIKILPCSSNPNTTPVEIISKVLSR